MRRGCSAPVPPAPARKDAAAGRLLFARPPRSASAIRPPPTASLRPPRPAGRSAGRGPIQSRLPRRSRMPRSSRSLAVASLLAIPLLAGCGAGGVGWSTYPPVRGQAAFGNPNRYPMPQVVTAALRYTLDRYPPPSPPAPPPAPVGGPAPGLLAGALATDRVAVHPLTAETAALPTYTVARVSIRGGQATVAALRPVYDLARATGGELPQQGLTLELQGGLTPWRVESRQIWAIG